MGLQSPICSFYWFSFLSLFPAVLYRVKDDLVNQLLDGRAVISKIDIGVLLLADMSIRNTGVSDTLQQRVAQHGSVAVKIAQRRWRIGTDYQTILKALRIYDV